MEILKEQQKRVKGNCTEVLFFITKDFRLEYISVQGRALLIYCYLMTMIIVSKLFLFLLFFIGKRMFFVTSVCLFHVVLVT